MTFWIVSTALTLAALLAVAIPMLRAGRIGASDSAHDIEVYRDQLDELDRDIERGAIDPDQAELARSEIARRLLKADAELSGDTPAAPTSSAGFSRYTMLSAVLAVPLIAWGGYALLGSPDQPDQPLRERLARAPSNSSVAELIARAEEQLRKNPGDVRGWDVLAPIYIATGRFDDSINAFENAIRIGGSTARREAGLGEALVGKGEGRVSNEAVAAFNRALTSDSSEPRARFYLATAKAQSGELEEAALMWEKLASDLPEDSPLRRAVVQAAADSRARMGQTTASDNAPGPTADDVAAASQMNSDDRQSMIETMVANLDEKLRGNPDDIEGWKRLLRSYMVLGKSDIAREALERAVEAFGKGSDKAAEISQFARSVGIEEPAQ